MSIRRHRRAAGLERTDAGRGAPPADSGHAVWGRPSVSPQPETDELIYPAGTTDNVLRVTGQMD